MLQLENLAVGYRGSRGAVVNAISSTVQSGEFVCILGRNGAGKSTLMRTLAGLQPALAGQALLNGNSIAAMSAASRAQQVAVVLTERVSSPGLRVADVVAMGRQPFTNWRGSLNSNDLCITNEALSAAGVEQFRARYLDDLSDGERQRVMIARALTQTARLMILDEITAFLDLPGRIEIMTMLKRHAQQAGMIVLLSSHDLDLSLQLAGTVWLLNGSGSMDIGSPDVLTHAGAISKAFDTDAFSFSHLVDRHRFRINP